ncbi:MAG: hypothetical protein LUE93_05810 [Bacteroides sp.]|nr:hypothetical protein [Bacteroides sp.]
MIRFRMLGLFLVTVLFTFSVKAAIPRELPELKILFDKAGLTGSFLMYHSQDEDP